MNGWCLSNNNGYSKMEVEEEEEMRHRRAQFLIYKSLKKADSLTQSRRSQPSMWLIKLRVFKLKIRIRKRLMRLRKTISSTFSAAKGGATAYNHVFLHLKSLKRLLSRRGEAAVSVIV